MKKCNICGFERECTEYVLTETERQAYKRLGLDAPDSCFYCKPCLRVATDKTLGPRLIQGLFHAGLKNVGVANASTTAERLRKHIEDLARAKSG